MYIQLMHRHYGLHRPIKHLEIPCNFSDVFLKNDNINEDLLLENIPDGWLPTDPQNILLAVADKNGSIGQCKLNKFRSWAKYFDAYCLELYEKPEEWWEDYKEE